MAYPVSSMGGVGLLYLKVGHRRKRRKATKGLLPVIVHDQPHDQEPTVEGKYGILSHEQPRLPIAHFCLSILLFNDSNVRAYLLPRSDLLVAPNSRNMVVASRSLSDEGRLRYE